jgi:hypothetical protein
MTMPERQTVLFGDTGVVAPIDTTDRVSLADGAVFVAQKIEVRPSSKYGEYVVFDGEDLDGKEFHAYSASGVVLQQAKALLEKYGGENGALSHDVLCAVKAVVSETSGRRFYTLV